MVGDKGRARAKTAAPTKAAASVPLGAARTAAAPHLRGLAGRGALLLLPLLFLLLQLLNALLQYVGPEVTLKVGQLLGTGEPVFSCLFEDILESKGSTAEKRDVSGAPVGGTGAEAVLRTPAMNLRRLHGRCFSSFSPRSSSRVLLLRGD